MHQQRQRARFRRAAVAGAVTQTNGSPEQNPLITRQQNSTTNPRPAHQMLLMRQQFYSNNERSQDGGGESQRHLKKQQPVLSETSHEHETHTIVDSNNHGERSQIVAAVVEDSTTTTRGSDNGASAAVHHQSLPKECLQQYNPAYHSASPSMPASDGYSTATTSGGHLVDFYNVSTSRNADAESQLINNSNSTLPGINSVALNFDCNANQLAPLMNIRTEDLNFADTEQVWLLKSWPEILARASLVAPIVLLGLIGNLTIIYSICRFKPIRSKPTNIFILNMALADLLTTIVCPNAALFTDIFQFYVLGSLVCRTEGFIKITCLLVSAYSLIVLSSDWFLSVVKPCRTRISIRQAWLTLAVIWLVSIAMASPLLHWRRLRERQWRDLLEVWCCEPIQYTKYYWICITLFLIYLPTCVMTIVLIVILCQMDRFEAKLKRTARGRRITTSNQSNQFGGATSSSQQFSGMSQVIAPPSGTITSASSITHNNNNNNSSSARISAAAASSSQQQQQFKMQSQTSPNSSLSIGMKYRRRIVKVLFFYLLTSIVCWTPLQFTIIYRHFRSEPVPAGWFFELTFYSQLSASLSAAMNPIIFGFLSQPFRRVVTKSWMFRFLDKVWTTNARTRSDPGGGGGENHAMNARQPQGAAAVAVAAIAPLNASQRHQLGSHRNLARGSGTNGRSGAVLTAEQEPKLTIDYVEHHQQHQHRIINHSSGQSTSTTTARHRAGQPRVYHTATQHHHQHQLHQPAAAIQRSRSSSQKAAGATPARLKRVSFNSKASNNSGGIENAAYIKNDDDEHHQQHNQESLATDKTTSFIMEKTATKTTTTTNGLKQTKNQDCDL